MKNIFNSLALFTLFIALLAGCSEPEKTITKLDEIKNSSIGAMTGSTGEQHVKKRFPQALVKSFDDIMDAVAALKSNQLDAVITGYPAAMNVCKHNPDLRIISEPVALENTAIAVRKGNDKLLLDLNNFIVQLKNDGTLQDMKNRWFKTDLSPYQEVEIIPPAKGEILKIGTSATREPFCFINTKKLVSGLDGELSRRIGVRLGRPVQFVDMKFSALIPALQSGKVDFICAGMTATDERRKSVNFTESYFPNSQVLIVKNVSVEKRSVPKSFLVKVGESFYNNIIVENRYLLIIEGLKTTIIISILATILGTLLGGLICFMRMSRKKLLSRTAKLYISVLRGTPVLVLLMIIFYVVFASVDIDPVLVAVIAFGLNFAAYVSEMYRTGIEGVDKGQTEAGIAMGFSKIKTFLYIVLPQAVKRILPVYKGEVISLVKMTSIVGYIAVQDLTKASDIVRSRTFDAFFPLIMVAVLYFLIAWLLMISLGYFERLTSAGRRG